jgi:hypothetical protein
VLEQQEIILKYLEKKQNKRIKQQPKGKEMKILYIRDPVWNPNKREWVINYGVSDYVDDKPVKYVQKVTTETLLSAQNYINLLNQRKER